MAQIANPADRTRLRIILSTPPKGHLMKVIFTGDPLELERGESLSRLSTTMYGVHFPMSAEVDVSHLDKKLQQKLLNNSHFRVAGVDAETQRTLIIPAGAVVAPLQAEAPAQADDDAEEQAAAAAHAERAKTRKKA